MIFTCTLSFASRKISSSFSQRFYMELPKELWLRFSVWKVGKTQWRRNIGVARVQENFHCFLEERSSMLVDIERRNSLALPSRIIVLVIMFLFFRAVLGSQQNWAEGTESSPRPLRPLHTASLITTITRGKGTSVCCANEPMMTHHYHSVCSFYIQIHF